MSPAGSSRTSKPAAWLAAVAVALLAACITTTESQPPGLDNRVIAKARAVRCWLAQSPPGRPGPAVGCVVRLEAVGDGGARFFYMVRNLYSQDLGLVDALGRGYRYRVHADEPEDLGAGTVAEGAGRILETADPVELIEIPLEDLEKRLRQELARKADERRQAGRSGRPGTR